MNLSQSKISSQEFRAFFLALMGASFAISISLSQILTGLFLVEWAVRSFRSSPRLPWNSSPLDKPILIFFVWGLMGFFLNRATTFGSALSAQSAFLLFFLGAHHFSGDDIKIVLRWFCFGAIGVGALGVVQHFSGVNFRPNAEVYVTPEAMAGWPEGVLKLLAVRNDRAMGTRSHPLTYAETLIGPFFLVLAALVSSPNEMKKRLWRIFGLLCILGGLFYSQARGVTLGVGAGVLLFGFLPPKDKAMRAAALIAIVLGAAAFLGSPRMRERTLSIFSTKSGTVGDQESKSTRFAIWRAAWEDARLAPVAGRGPKGTKLRVADPSTKQEKIWGETHNIFLQVLNEGGVVGFGLFCWILFVALKILRRTPAPWPRAAAAAFATFLSAGLTESWTRDKEIAMIFWLLIGCAEGLRLKPTGENA